MNDSATIYNFDEIRERKQGYDLNNGYTRIANQILDDLVVAPLNTTQLKMLIFVIRKTYGYGKKTAEIANKDFVAALDISKNRISENLKILTDSGVLIRGPGIRDLSYEKYPEKWDFEKLPQTGTVAANRNKSCRKPELLKITPYSSLKKKESSNTSYYLSKHRQDGASTPAEIEQEKKPAKRVIVPYQAIIDLYHEVLPMMPKVMRITQTRKGHISARWKSGNLPDLETWRMYFEYVKGSKFLTNGSERENGSYWKADIDFLIKENSFVKIWEGKYHNV